MEFQGVLLGFRSNSESIRGVMRDLWEFQEVSRDLKGFQGSSKGFEGHLQRSQRVPGSLRRFQGFDCDSFLEIRGDLLKHLEDNPESLGDYHNYSSETSLK